MFIKSHSNRPWPVKALFFCISLHSLFVMNRLLAIECSSVWLLVFTQRVAVFMQQMWRQPPLCRAPGHRRFPYMLKPHWAVYFRVVFRAISSYFCRVEFHWKVSIFKFDPSKIISNFYVFSITFFSMCLRSMGFMKNPLAFLRILESVIQITGYRFIILTAGYEPLEVAICTIANKPASKRSLQEGVSIFNGMIFCYSGWVQIFTSLLLLFYMIFFI